MVSNIPRSIRLVTFAAILAGGLLDTTVSAQYFGRNKVQYKNLDFQVLKTEHFDIHFSPDAREGAEIAARLAERWRARLGRLFNHELSGRQTLILYASHPDFEQTNTTGGEVSEGTGGFTESVKRRIVLPMAGPIADTDHVLGHELVHAFQFDITSRPGAGENGAERLPLWFIEGMAEYFSLGPVDSNTAMWMRDAVRQENDRHKLPDIKDLDNPKYFPYRWGHAFWAYVGGKWGDAAVVEMLEIAGSTGNVDLAMSRTLGVKSKELSEEWHTAMRRAYAVATEATENTGTVIIKSGGAGSSLNVGPAVSPDGRKVAFLSERDLLSIDLFIADAATGKVLRKLTSTASDPHYSSIQFILSAGAWHPDSQRFAIATISSGRPAIAVFNTESGDKEREFRLGTLDEAFNPTWAPDGHALAFTGMSRGLTDLYVLDVGTSVLKPLTHDAYADLQPSWSPDGRQIAFTTDRFSSNLDTLSIGAYRVALIDPQSGTIRQVSAFTDGKNINPQWSPDGGSLFFVSDRDGVPNLYRVSVPGGAVTQLTTAYTGLSGISSTSPALSVATQTGAAVFSVYADGGYDIRTLQLGPTPPDSSVPSGSRIELSPASSTAAVLPPLDRSPSDVYALLTNPTLGLPPEQSGQTEDYKPRLKLETVGQPQVSVGYSTLGPSVGGGISFGFADLLGDHHLDTAVQVGTNLSGSFSAKDTAAIVTYMNQANRWNWGVSASQIPYSSGQIQQAVGIVGGQLGIIDETTTFRQTERGASGLLAYPFSRARRVEFQGGLTQVSFDQIVRTRGYSLTTGDRFYDQTQTSAFGAPLTLATSSAAMVYDTTSFGATSPVQGERYRLEASPTFGSVDYTGVLADYRRYFMPVSYYTIAARALHYGRYGSGGDDSRLVPLYLGYSSLVRGYDINTFDATDCVATTTSTCPIFDRLVGSRILVGNLEFRFPLLRPFGVSPSMYGPLPVEVALFADGGVTWDGASKPTFLGGDRKGISSVGTAFRVNILGFMVGEFAWSRPLQRSNRGWIFQFNLTPGF